MTNALPPAHWAVDPTGRHEYRYWDGVHWTDHVADRGAQSVDPLGTADGTERDTSPDDTSPDDTSSELSSSGDATPATAIATSWPPSLEPEPDAGAVVAADGDVVAEPDAAVVLAPPPPPPPAPGTGYAGATRGTTVTGSWRGLDGLRTALVVLLVTSGVSTLATILTLSTRVAAIESLGDGVTFQRVQDLSDADDAVTTSAAVMLVLLIATAVVWIVWQWRAAKNVEALGRAGAKFGPGWSIGAWFIPFANLVIPVMIVQGLWRATAPGTEPGTRWTDGRRSALVGWWWGLFLAGNILGRSTTTEEVQSRDIVGGRLDTDKFTGSDTTAIAGFTITVAAVVLAIMVVVQLTRRFNARRAEAPGLIDV